MGPFQTLCARPGTCISNISPSFFLPGRALWRRVGRAARITRLCQSVLGRSCTPSTHMCQAPRIARDRERSDQRGFGMLPPRPLLRVSSNPAPPTAHDDRSGSLCGMCTE